MIRGLSCQHDSDGNITVTPRGLYRSLTTLKQLENNFSIGLWWRKLNKQEV